MRIAFRQKIRHSANEIGAWRTELKKENFALDRDKVKDTKWPMGHVRSKAKGLTPRDPLAGPISGQCPLVP